MRRRRFPRAHAALLGVFCACFGAGALAGTPAIELLSRAQPGTTAVGGTGSPLRQPWSADGRYVVITSAGPDLVPGQLDDNRTSDVFLVDRESRSVVLVSHTANSARHAANRASVGRAISANGRYVVFVSDATDLASGMLPPGGRAQVFLYDAMHGQIRLVSRAHDDAQVGANAGSSAVAVDDEGRVLFHSEATNLVPDDTGGTGLDVFLFDAATGTVRLVSHPWDEPGRSAGGTSTGSALRGGRVLYQSTAPGLVQGLAPRTGTDVYLYDIALDSSLLVSRRTADGQRAGSSIAVELTPDASHVLFASTAADVTDVPDFNLQTDAFVFERATGIVRTVARSIDAERMPDSVSVPIDLSADGQRVLLHSAATDLLSGMERYVGVPEAFVVDLRGGPPILVTHSTGQPLRGLGGSAPYAISAAGDRVLYGTVERDVVSGIADPDGSGDIFLYDLASSTATLVTRHAGSATATGSSRSAAFGAGDTQVLYRSDAVDLVPGVIDGNGVSDVFVYDVPSGAPELVLGATGAVRGTPPGLTYTTTMSPDGRAALLWGESRLVGGMTPGTAMESYHVDRASRVVTRLPVPLPSAPHVETNRALHMTDDGATVLFNSAQRWMSGVPTDENGGADTFLRDIGTAGPPQLLSRSVVGPFTTANRPTFGTAMDRSGRYALLIGYATDLVAGVTDAPQTVDLFLFDRQTSTTTLVTHPPGQPTVAAGGVEHAWLSPDGEWILVTCSAALVAGVQDAYPSWPDLYLIERATRQVTLVSHLSGRPLEAAPGRYFVTGMTADAGTILISSDAADLVDGQVDANGRNDVFVYERVSSAMTLISHLPGAPLSTGLGGGSAVLSADGHRVLFDRLLAIFPDFGSQQTELVLYDRPTAGGVVIAGPQISGGSGGYLYNVGVALSHDGRRVLFHSSAAGLDPDVVDVNGWPDVFVHDVDLGRTTLVSRSALAPGRSGNQLSYATDFTDDGTGVLFWSRASDLTEAIDLNAVADAFYATVDYEALFSGGFEGRAAPP